jgi:predicted DNA-binding protein
MTTNKMSDTTKQFNVRLPKFTQAQIKALEEKTGMTVTQIVILAIDRMAQSEEVIEKPE